MPPRIMKDDLGSEKHEHLIPESMEIEKDIFCKVCNPDSFYSGFGISTLVKSKVKILQNFVAFLEYINFKRPKSAFYFHR